MAKTKKNDQVDRFVEETLDKLATIFQSDIEESYAIFVLALGKKAIDVNPDARKGLRGGLKKARAELKEYSPRAKQKRAEEYRKRETPTAKSVHGPRTRKEESGSSPSHKTETHSDVPASGFFG